MAVRFECPVYTYEFILDAAGVILEDNEEGADSITKPVEKQNKPEVKGVVGLAGHTMEELENLLGEVLSNEDYERAAEIRDEIKKRNG